MVNYCKDCKDVDECDISRGELERNYNSCEGWLFKLCVCGHQAGKHELARDPASSSTGNGALATIWSHLNTPLPELKYDNEVIAGQQKHSTKWAAQSHTPVQVVEWQEFDGLITGEAKRSQNQVKSDVRTELTRVIARYGNLVEEEEHVTMNTVYVLKTASALLGADFMPGSKFLKANTDIVSTRKEEGSENQSDKSTLASAYALPLKPRQKQFAQVSEARRKDMKLPIETKPFWKFRFMLDKGFRISHHWKVPGGDWKGGQKLPDAWSHEQEKVFHLVRQVYGQMVTDNFRYGIINLYECWFFCCRDAEGVLSISRAFRKESTSPSVLQGLKTVLSFDDLYLEESKSHFKSSPSGRQQSGQQRSHMSIGPDGSQLKLSQCHLMLSLDYTKILITKCGKGMVKMVSHPSFLHHIEEIRNEAKVYQLLEDSPCSEFIPRFYGFDESVGVPLLCTSREGDDFEEIGIENLSSQLLRSALEAVKALSACGVYHGDLALRNIVQSLECPLQAKLIDFGRSRFTKDTGLLQHQIDDVKKLLHFQ